MPIRVVQVSFAATAKTFLCEHFRRLRKEGFEVVFACSDDDNAAYVAEVTGARHCPVPVKQSLAPLSDMAGLYKLWGALRRLRPQIVHAHMSKPGIMGMLAGWLAGAPVRIYHTHGLALLTATGLSRLVLRSVEWLTNRLATDVVFCSQSTLEAAVASGVALRRKCRVLGPGTVSGVDVEVYAPDRSGRRRAEQRKAWGVDDDEVVVGFVGRLLVEKGIATLIEAWRRLDAASRSRARLILVGDFVHMARREEEIKTIVQQAVSEGIGVSVAGWVEDMVSCYSGMDVLILLSWREGFPYCILEAQSMGLPVIASRVTGNVDAVEHDITGLIVPVRDPEATARAITRLLKDNDLRQRLGKAAREKTLRDFDQEKIYPLFIEEYHRLLRLRMRAHSRQAPAVGAKHRWPSGRTWRDDADFGSPF